MSFNTSTIKVRPVRAFSDNYIWMIESPSDPLRLVAVDPGEADPVIAELKRSGASLAAILLTHHHPDHVGGVGELLRHWNVPVYGPEDSRIARPIRSLGEGPCDLSDLGLGFQILQVPGHTVSHIAFWGHGALFCGDTLFSAGCGRMFEGTPTQMNASLNRLRDLPLETRVFCGHEYTAANIRFAKTIEPTNVFLAEREREVAELIAAQKPTVPSYLGEERAANPFLRADAPEVAQAVGLVGHPAWEVFAEIRERKNKF